MTFFLFFPVQKNDEADDELTTEGQNFTSRKLQDNRSKNSLNHLYSLLVIPIFAIFIGVLIGLLKRYGCTLLVNFARRVSNYVLNINDTDNDLSVHTPSAVNEILDALSTETYGSSSISSLSWDPRIRTEAEVISRKIKDMNNQATQTSDHSSSIINDSNESIIAIDYNAPLSPIELYPSFTFDIQVESDVDEDITQVKLRIDPEGSLISISNVTRGENIKNNNVSPTIELYEEDSLEEITFSQSCTGSGLVYK